MNDMNLGQAFYEMELDAEVWLSTERVPLERLTSLHPGDVLQLTHDPDGPVDLVVNGTVVATGELVVVDGRFGLRITGTVQQGLTEMEQSAGQAAGTDPAGEATP